MSKLPRAREVISVIKRRGFFFSRQKGGHAIYKNAEGKRVTVPIHGGRQIIASVFNQILNDLGITAEEFWKTK
ncbi:MAG: hypothetical protein A3C06_02500 [Candidatus Taylorbacteria bacterium RIFCSPHIGHO2_02_FULL_46_13]|uniref:Addiction module toxin, HicA family n=1 Tax=Candidatus Taylorbacteria bacterium RIFCSPHIGHO2_02_FULL_46_13 TaxID=1802312 RepID=A0A1G2MST2_9BACT|nr:MAG: hypothetical protein A3C06_02500 [Candidatus Taylorbacteria bacterium RIFCSPHIGHO2_02_FULL_46_13]